MECNDPKNHYVHERMQLKFLIHYEAECGGRFGGETFFTERQAVEECRPFSRGRNTGACTHGECRRGWGATRGVGARRY